MAAKEPAFRRVCHSGAVSPRLRYKFERAREAGADARRTEVATVAGQNPVHLSALGECRDRAVDQPEIEVFELGIELQSPNEIGRKRQLVVSEPGTF